MGYKYLFVLAFIFLMACNQPEMLVADDENIRIEAIKKVQDGELIFHVRIYPEKDLGELVKQKSSQIMYQTDSLFYLGEQSNPVYPISTEYIPGGNSRALEYMIVFSELNTNYLKSELNYQDKYLNKQHYKLRKK